MPVALAILLGGRTGSGGDHDGHQTQKKKEAFHYVRVFTCKNMPVVHREGSKDRSIPVHERSGVFFIAFAV